jgi:hypothetical protein
MTCSPLNPQNEVCCIRFYILLLRWAGQCTLCIFRELPMYEIWSDIFCLVIYVTRAGVPIHEDEHTLSCSSYLSRSGTYRRLNFHGSCGQSNHCFRVTVFAPKGSGNFSSHYIWSLSGPFWEKRETETDATDLQWNLPMFDYVPTADADPSNSSIPYRRMLIRPHFDC